MSDKEPAAEPTMAEKNRRLLVKLALVVAGMFVFAVFVMPPLYDAFCEITGLNGKGSGKAAAAPARADDTRSVNVEFLVDTDAALPWEFRKGVAALDVHPGEITKTLFFVKNLDSKAVTGRAVPSISPSEAAQYFKKTECFCFREQRLEGGAEKEMPMVFYVDPALPRHITTITLSYKFYNMNKP
ncbi:MAG TPA: cytochrome c oxidase assembly protein [Moraxellaceae bacterium]